MLFYPQGVKIINSLLLGVYEFMIFTIFEKNFNLSEKFSSSQHPLELEIFQLKAPPSWRTVPETILNGKDKSSIYVGKKT